VDAAGRQEIEIPVLSQTRPLPDPLECVLFDAGDTLLGPSPSFHGRFVQVAARHGFEVTEINAAAAIAGAGRAVDWQTDWTDLNTRRAFWLGFYRHALAELGHRGNGAALAEALYQTFSDPTTYKLFPDVRAALDTLAGRGITLGIVSNFEPWLEKVLALEGIDNYFIAVAISGKLGIAKPAPAIFLAALEQANVAAEATVYVGDHPVDDVEAARAVGIVPVLMDRFRRLPAASGHRVESMTELVALLCGEPQGDCAAHSV
jgi:putative hydrolase of the HAD superfamily